MPWWNPNFDKITNIFGLLLKIVLKLCLLDITIPEDNFKTHFETLKRCIPSKKVNLSKNIFHFSHIFTNFYWRQGFWKNYGFCRHHLAPYSFWNPLEIRLLFQISYDNIVAYDGIQIIFPRISKKFDKSLMLGQK